MADPSRLRFLGYTDYVYRRRPDGVYADRAFAVFLSRVGTEFRAAAIAGRVLDSGAGARYRIPERIGLVAMPWYDSLADPRAVARALRAALRTFGGALEEADVVWLLGPHPIELALAVLARARGRRVALGVRQDFVAYVRSRHPRRPLLRLAGYALEATWRALALVLPVVVVGEDLARRYRHARALLPITVSLLRDEDLAGPEVGRRDYGGELRALSVGRLEEEKNPLLLADVLAELVRRDPRWRMTICGEGPLEPDLRARLAELGVAERADLVGYVPLDAGLLDLYRGSHVLLHVSFTEGVPQVLHEAFASRLPVVATAVGGVPAAAGDAALLIEPGRADEAAAALTRLATDAELRARLIERGAAEAAAHTLEAEAQRVARFLAGP